MYSDKLKLVMWLELTSPWEDNLTDSYIRKKSTYNRLQSECRTNGWSVIPMSVEVGALGHINIMWGEMSKEMGIPKAVSEPGANAPRLRCAAAITSTSAAG